MHAIQDSPFFLPLPQEESGGVDYLGMRAVNLQMMDDLLPGLNNVADCIRPFSLLAWTIWVYEDYHRQHDGKMTAKEFTEFREKIEALFILSHRLAQYSVSGIAGSQQATPRGSRVTLRFRSLGRNAGNTLINAVNYGPGLKGDSGLHFAYPEPRAPGIFRVTTAGKNLAMALDESLRNALTDEQYVFLCSPKELVLSADEAMSFADAWQLHAPSIAEQRHFYARLYPREDNGPREQARCATIDLIVAVLTQLTAPATAHEIRRNLVMATLPALDARVEEARLRWKALQLRQAQRLAMEALFGWMECCIWQDDTHTTSAFAKMMTDAIQRERPRWHDKSAISDRLEYYRGLAEDSEALFARGWEDPECDVVGAAARLQNDISGPVRQDQVVVNAFDLLILVAVHTEHFMRSPSLAPYVVNTALHRLPLNWWASTINAHFQSPLRVFIERTIESWLISQHLGVAASRSSIDSGRMRLTIDDAGIGSLLASEDKCWTPVLTPDRIETVLSLLSECGKLSCFKDNDVACYAIARTPTDLAFAN